MAFQREFKVLGILEGLLVKEALRLGRNLTPKEEIQAIQKALRVVHKRFNIGADKVILPMHVKKSSRQSAHDMDDLIR